MGSSVLSLAGSGMSGSHIKSSESIEDEVKKVPRKNMIYKCRKKGATEGFKNVLKRM